EEADAIYRRTPCRGYLTVVASPADTPESVSFFPCVQAIVRHAAASLSHRPPHRTREEPADRTQAVGHGNWTRCGLQRNELIYVGLWKIDRGDTARLPPQLGIKATGASLAAEPEAT